jgi:cardiolipin synthase
LSLPNTITFVRIFIVPFFFTELISYKSGSEHHLRIAMILFATATFTDALDGFLARVMKCKTELGTFLDPLADKLLLLSGYLGLLFVDALPYKPPLWITVTIVFRDLMILIGLAMIYVMSGKIPVRPNFLGKCTTAAQMLTFIAILLKWEFSFLLWNTMAALTIVSFYSYFRREASKMMGPPA